MPRTLPTPHLLPDLRRRALLMTLSTGAVLGVAAPRLARAQPMPLGQALNVGGRMRSLSMRSAKAYGQAALGITPEKALAVVDAAQGRCVGALRQLASVEMATPAKEALEALRQEHAAFQRLLSSPPGKDQFLAVTAQSDRVFDATTVLTNAMRAGSNQPVAQLITSVGFLRNRSQRLARDYYLVAVGQDNSKLRDRMASDRADFVGAVKLLSESTKVPQAARNELALVQSQWAFFDAALSRKPDPTTLGYMSTTSDRIYESGDAIAAQVELVA